MSQKPITMNKKLDNLLSEARAIRLAMTYGALSYSEAKERVEPLLQKVNRAGAAIARKYGRTYRQINFSDL